MASSKPHYKVTNLRVDLQTGTTNTYYATWKFAHKTHLDEYEVVWVYSTGDGVRFEGSSSSTKETNATYSPPDNAIKIWAQVRPKSKEKSVKKNKKTVKEKYFIGEWNDYGYTIDMTSVIDVPPTPGSPEIKGLDAYLSVTNYDPLGNYTVTDIEFQIINKDTNEQVGDTLIGTYNKSIGTASVIFKMPPGGMYIARARAIVAVTLGDKVDASEWSSFCSEFGTVPGSISGKPTLTATSSSSVRVEWEGIPNVEGYEVQYVKDNAEYFDTTDPESVKLDDNTTTKRDITGLEFDGNPTYFFRVRGYNDNTEYNNGNGGWSEIASIKLGSTPEAPTIWTYTTTCKIGDVVELNWAHNSEDQSEQSAAEVEIIINGSSSIRAISGDTATLEYNTTGLSDGTEISWRVRTKGAMPDFSEWSTIRKFIAYVPPTISANIFGKTVWQWDPFVFDTDTIYYSAGAVGEDPIDTVTSFPFTLQASASPATQTAISFSIRIISGSSYDYIDDAGYIKSVYAGDEIYNGYFTPNANAFSKTFSPSDIDLENGVTYTVYISVSMDTGLSGEMSFEFDVEWQDEELTPNAEISVDYSNLACYIRPFCMGEDEIENDNVWFSIYRLEYDGSYTEVAKDIDGQFKATAVDPHPALNYARYRIVAVSKDTGSVGYYDLPPEPIEHNAIVIQWDEQWTMFDNSIGSVLDRLEQPWQGSMIQLPYNVDVSADANPDVALAEYIGRTAPVSYYGTQKRETSKWSCEIPKADTETLFQIRRLAAYMGDVYVREPSGLGYWAHVQVTYNLNHLKQTVPVSFSITKVSGGV